MSKPTVYKQELPLPDGRVITIETGALAKFANGAVTVSLGNMVMLATIVAAKEAKEGIDFLPMTVDYQEKYASSGRFPGGFLKREARPSDHEILISRLIDRALRPLFADDYHLDTMVMVQLYSNDKNVSPESLAGLAASAAIAVSDIPVDVAMSEVKVARINGEFKVNPFVSEMEHADLDLVVAASETDITMVEGEMKEVSEQVMVDALKFAHAAIKDQLKGLRELREKCGKPKFDYAREVENEELKQKASTLFEEKLKEIAYSASTKEERSDAFTNLFKEYKENLPEDSEEDIDTLKKYYNQLKSKVVRNMILTERKRLDGRGLEDIRPIWCEVDVLPSVHGSSIFTRGETQALATITLGSKLDEQLLDGATVQGNSRFLLHYNFPGFSTGEAKPNRGTGRREIGHGNLALRALKPMIPQDFPYTIRITSDILESNGSSSMATVCSGTLALFDAGVKITRPVSGIAMGLIQGEDGSYAILSDILGDEDHLGDMDFKVTGTKEGITACQMDLKVNGLPFEVIEEALMQANRGRNHILDEMLKVQDGPRADYKEFVPRIERLEIEKEFIGAVIGTGGKIIQQIQRETETVVTIEEVGNKGIVEISGVGMERIQKAINWIKGIVAVPEDGTVYTGTVKSIMAFGAFVEFLPGKEGLLHVSEISYDRVNEVSDILSEGDVLEVKLLETDKATGKFRLSRKALLPKPEGYVERERPSGQNRSDRGVDRRNNDRNRGGGGRR